MLFLLVTGEAYLDLSSFSSSSAQSAQRHLPAQLTAVVYLQICNYLSLSAFHICLLRSSSLSLTFECHFGVICHYTTDTLQRRVFFMASSYHIAARFQRVQADPAVYCSLMCCNDSTCQHAELPTKRFVRLF